HGNYDGAPSDESVWEDGGDSYLVYRGGSWIRSARDCRSASRDRVGPRNCNDYLGFRLLREV
ncbi:MAG: hypothetical protein QG646_1740, partial [Euryarchaeota archaeon]|nr:hypothetical protein [Euryarchaeota archaeon]